MRRSTGYFMGFAALLVLGIGAAAWAQLQLQVRGPGIGANGKTAETEPRTTSVDINRNLARDLNRAKERLQSPEFAPAIEFLQERILDRPDDFFLDQEMTTTAKAEARKALESLNAEQRRHYDLRYAATAQQLLETARNSQDLEGVASVARRYFLTDAGAEAAYFFASSCLDRGRPLQAALLFAEIPATASLRWEPTFSVKQALSWRLAGQAEKATVALIEGRKRTPKARFERGTRNISWFTDDSAALAWLDDVASVRQRTPRIALESEWTGPRGSASRNGSARDVSPVWRPLWRQETSSRGEMTDAESTKKAVAELTRIEKTYSGTSFLTLPAASPIGAVDVVPPVVSSDLADSANPSGSLDLVVFRSLANVRAVDLSSGKTVWESIQIDPTYERIVEGDLANAQANGQPQGTPLQNFLTQRAFRDLTAGTLSTDGERVYSVEEVGLISPFRGYATIRNAQNPISDNDSNRLVAAELSTGRLLWEVGGPRTTRELPLAGNFFLGPPLALDDKLYVIGENGGEISLHVLESATGNVLWSQSLAVPELSLELLTNRRLVGLSPAESNGILVCTTDGGAVLAIDLTTRRLRWGRRYGTNSPNLNANPAVRFQIMNMARMGQSGVDDESRWLDSTPLIADGCAIVTPRDSEEMYCIDLLDGSLLWKRPRGQSLYVAGIVNGNVVVVGRTVVEALQLRNPDASTPNAPPAPKAAWREPTPISMPSGRGVRTGNLYHLPLSTGEVATLDLASGRLLARSKTTDGAIPGNLIAIRGTLVSQTTSSITALEGLESIEQRIAESLQKQPDDAMALALRGQLELHRGQTQAALNDLRLAVRADPKSPARPVLASTLLEGLRHDFANHRAFSDEIEQLIDEPQQRAAFLRLTAAGLAQVGERQAAFQQYLKLLAPDAASPTLERLGGDLSVRSDRWGRARLAEIVAAGGEEERRVMDETVQKQLEKVLATNDLSALKGFVGTFGELALADRARRQIAERLDPRKESLAYEFLLMRLRESDEKSHAAFAVSRLIDLDLDRDCQQRIPELLGALEKDFAEIPVADGKTGKDLSSELKADDNVLQLLAGPAAWPDRNFEAKKTGRRGNVEQEFPIDIVGPRGLFDGWKLFIDSRRQSIVARDNQGQDRWTVRVETLKDPRRPADPPKMIPNIYGNSARVLGHQMVLTLGSYFVVLDTLAPGASPQVLWMRDLQDNVGVAANPYGIQPRQIVLPNGARKMEIVDSLQRPLGSVGVLNEDYLAYQVGTTLIAADPLSGDVLWERKNVARGSEIFGDRDFVFQIAPASQQVSVFRATDGELVGTRSIPAPEARLLTEGRRVVSWQKSAEKTELSVIDASNSRRIWTREFAADARSSIIKEEEIAVFDSTGRLTIYEIATGATRLEAELQKVDDLENIHVLRTTGRYILLTSKPAAAAGKRVQLFNNFNKTMIVNGPAYGFDRETGKILWMTNIEHQQIELNQPDDLPVAIFAALRFNLQAGGQFRGAQEWSVQLIDLRNGKTLFNETSSMNTIPYRLRVDSTKKAISVDFYNSGIEVTVTESPLLPGELPAAPKKVEAAPQ